MASISNDPGGRRRIMFFAPDGSRKSIRLGKVDRKTAESISGHVEHLLSRRINGGPIPRQTVAWLEDIGDKLKEKLSAVDLLETSKKALLGQFLQEYILGRLDIKPATREIWGQPVRNLCEHFGENKPLRNITPGDAERFKEWLIATQGLASATLAKRLAFARTFFHTARKHRFIESNPFSEVKIPTANVSARQQFVDRETTEKLLSVAQPTWRTIIGLSRFGGLRCPSEVLSIEWRHIDWERGRVTVPSPKTDRYDGKASRMIPLFPELREILTDARELAEEGEAYVVGLKYFNRSQGKSGWRSANLRTTFGKLIKRAGLEAWPRLFHNLRSSRETELLEEFPVHVVAKWLGHDPKVAMKHYAQMTEDHFERATKSGAQNGAQVAQNEAQKLDVAKSN